MANASRMKQLKSRAHDIRELFERSITVRHVAEFDLKTCQADEDTDSARKHMEHNDFDVLPMEEGATINGYVEKSTMGNGQCKDYLHVFHPSELIADSTPLIYLLPILRDKPRVFVIECNRVSGIVTRGDLQKAPVRMLLFGLVTLVEMQLLRLVRICYCGDRWKPCLTPCRVQRAEKLFAERKAKSEAIDLADCLQFCDKRDLILKVANMPKRLGLGSKESGASLLRDAEELRNNLAHGQDIVAGSSWEKVIDLAKRIEEVLEQCEQIETARFLP